TSFNSQRAQATTLAPKPPGFAFAKGHTLVLHLNNLVFVYNLAERREVWRYNLYGSPKSLLNNNKQINLYLDEHGRVGINHSTSGLKERMGGVAVLEPSYVCLQ